MKKVLKILKLSTKNRNKYHKFFLQSFSKVSSIFLYFSKIGMGILAMRGEMEKGSKGLHLVFNSLDKS